MINKFSYSAQRSSDITDEERQAAREATRAFSDFIKKLWAVRQQDLRLVNVLEKTPDADSSSLKEQRHLLRRFQRGAKERYTDLIQYFAGKKDNGGNLLSKGIIHKLAPLEKDTKTRQLKTTIQDAMQQLKEFAEEFIEAFEDFNDKDQVSKILNASKTLDELSQSLENIVDKQLKPHFEQNIIRREQIIGSDIQNRFIRRARILKILEA